MVRGKSHSLDVSLEFKKLANESSEPIFYCNAQGDILYTNNSWQGIFGLSLEESTAKGFADVLLPDKKHEITTAWHSGLAHCKPFNMNCAISRKDGEIRYLNLHILPAEFVNDTVATFVGCVEDRTENLQYEYELEIDKAKFNLLVKYSPYSINMINEDGEILSSNSAGLEILGVDSENELSHFSFLDRVIEKDQAKVKENLKKAACGNVVTFEYETINDRVLQACLIPMEQSKNNNLLALIQDLTIQRHSEDIIWRQANFDDLTQLPNRSMFTQILDQEIHKAKTSNQMFALLFMDLDRFKEVNDTLGHSMGDILLIEAAHRIISCVRETDVVARFGGDEFAVIIKDLNEFRDIERLVQTLVVKLATPYYLDEETAIISASVGIVMFPNDSKSKDELLKFADQAMFEAKKKGRNRYCFFDVSMQKHVEKNRHLLNDMREGLLRSQFSLYYQPIMDLKTDKIIKAESLIRWHHPERGLISPADFIPVAEETGIIVDLGNWVFYQAVQQLREWRKEYDVEVQISINKSPIQFLNQRLRIEDNWVEHMRHMRLPGNCITIEITEGLLLENEEFITTKLQELRDAGCQIALDDFGTGYSSLSYLQKFQIDFLKIDQSFVKNIDQNVGNFALCQAIIAMAQKLDIKVIAEGVETVTQRDMLKEAGCEYAQGYYYSKPLPADEFAEKYLSKS